MLDLLTCFIHEFPVSQCSETWLFGVVNRAPPVGVVNLPSPVGMVNLVPPVGAVNLTRGPVGVVNPAIVDAKTGNLWTNHVHVLNTKGFCLFVLYIFLRCPFEPITGLTKCSHCKQIVLNENE